MSDEQLLGRAAQGDRAAFQQLYYLYHPRLRRFLLRLSRRHEVAQEIINETMLIVWQRASTFRGESRASTWILGIAYRRALKALKRESLFDAHVPPDAAEPEAVEPLDLAYKTELADWLETALAQLSPTHRVVIELAYMLDLPCEEIAGIVDCPVSTVKTRMFYARKHLRALLANLAAPAADARRFTT